MTFTIVEFNAKSDDVPSDEIEGDDEFCPASFILRDENGQTHEVIWRKDSISCNCMDGDRCPGAVAVEVFLRKIDRAERKHDDIFDPDFMDWMDSPTWEDDILPVWGSEISI